MAAINYPPRGVQKLRIVATLELDTRMFPPHDKESQDWLINDILLGERLVLHSNEIGDVVGDVLIESVE